MATTTNYSWTTPDDTDLVKDGASAIRTLGSAIDTTVFNNAAAAVAKSTIDAKGDLLVGTADDTVGRLAVGTDGYTLVAKSSEATGLAWEAPAAGGGMTLLASGAHSGTTLTLSSIPTTYNYLVVFFDSFDPGADQGLRMRVNNDSNTRYHSAASVDIGAGAFSATSWAISPINDDVVITNNLVITIPNYAQANGWKMAIGEGLFVEQTTTTSFNYQRKIGLYNQTTAITELNFFESGSNSFSVNYKLYGVK